MLDQDGQQEYECLVLEGYPPQEAEKMARSANNNVNRLRLAGPRSPSREGHGLAPLISDMTYVDIYEANPSVTQDTRTDLEREQDWAMRDSIEQYLDMLTPLQRAVIVDLYGLETGEPMSYRDVAIKHGHGDNPNWTRKRRTQALGRIRATIANPPLTDEQRAERRKKLRRENKRRQRAKARANKMSQT